MSKQFLGIMILIDLNYSVCHLDLSLLCDCLVSSNEPLSRAGYLNTKNMPYTEFI